MRNSKYTDEQVKFLTDNAEMKRKDLYDIFVGKFGIDVNICTFRRDLVRLGIMTGRRKMEIRNTTEWPIGYCLVDTLGYVRMKVEHPNVWEYKHRYLWERENGPVPKDNVLMFRDGNKQNCDLSNLALVKKSERMIMNHYGLNNMPEELFDTAVLLAKIRLKGNERMRDG